MAVGHGPTYRQVSQVLSPRIEDDLLEIGCGSGGLLARHAAHVHQVAGIDLSQVQVGMASTRSSALGAVHPGRPGRAGDP